MAWNVTICSPPSLLRLSTKSRGEVQMLGVASPQMSPTSVIRDEVDQNIQGGNILVGSPKRQFYSAFDQQQDEVVVEDEVNVIEGSVVEGGGNITTLINGKKRRLTGEQVRYLEESFEAENKLEPERKLQIASQLGLQPRQVAVWFQNRRARSKSKQLERDFTILKAKYDAVLSENRKLHAEVVRLTSLLQGNDSEGNAAQITGCCNTTSMASVGVKIELEVSTTATSPPTNINNTTLHVNELTSSQCNILESPKSEVLDSLTPPPLMNTSNGTTTSMAVPLPLISPAAAAAAAVLAAAKAEASSNVVDAAATTSTTILSSATTTTTTTTSTSTSTTPDADFVIANMTTATATSTSTSTSNPLLVQQLSLCKLEGGCLTEDYNLIFAQWPDINATGAHHLNLQPLHHDNNLFIAQYWDEPNIMLDPWYE